VLNPQNTENGFVDEKPPYNKMYYRVFISFDAGAYVFGESERPVKETTHPLPIVNLDELKVIPPPEKTVSRPGTYTDRNRPPVAKDPVRPGTEIKTEVITYPSRRIYTAREGNIQLNLANAEAKKYSVRFFDEADKPLFELNKIKDDLLIIEKVNFLHAGWFYFEVYESGKLIERNKFYIPKDGKN
jgi:hypothetical protein